MMTQSRRELIRNRTISHSMATELNTERLKVLSPLNELKTENLYALLKKIELLEAKRGQTLFKKGDTVKRTVYVLSGTIELKEDNEIVQTITGGTDEARSPIAPMLPRQQTAAAAGDVEYISIDSELLDVTLTWDKTGIYEVDDFKTKVGDENADWMTKLLQIKAFHKIPPANIQTIFMRLQQVNYNAKDIVVKQGDEADYFYVITRGRCLVTREMPLNKEDIQLAQLAVGDTFGEEALISGAKRSATIRMESDGALMRLSKDDFLTLLKEPMIEWVDDEEAEQVVADGGQWLDVRLPNEFEASHKDGAVNVPLYLFRLKLDTLDPGTKYIVCCDTGQRSSAAAFILNEHDFQAVVLKDGLNRS